MGLHSVAMPNVLFSLLVKVILSVFYMKMCFPVALCCGMQVPTNYDITL